MRTGRTMGSVGAEMALYVWVGYDKRSKEKVIVEGGNRRYRGTEAEKPGAGWGEVTISPQSFQLMWCHQV